MKKKIVMEAYIELDEGESIVYFVAKTLKDAPAPLRERRMRVPEYITHDLPDEEVEK